MKTKFNLLLLLCLVVFAAGCKGKCNIFVDGQFSNTEFDIPVRDNFLIQDNDSLASQCNTAAYNKSKLFINQNKKVQGSLFTYNPEDGAGFVWKDSPVYKWGWAINECPYSNITNQRTCGYFDNGMGGFMKCGTCSPEFSIQPTETDQFIVASSPDPSARKFFSLAIFPSIDSNLSWNDFNSKLMMDFTRSCEGFNYSTKNLCGGDNNVNNAYNDNHSPKGGLWAGASLVKRGDVNGDGVINSGDQIALYGYITTNCILSKTGDPSLCSLADLNYDGIVSSADITMFHRIQQGLEKKSYLFTYVPQNSLHNPFVIGIHIRTNPVTLNETRNIKYIMLKYIP